MVPSWITWPSARTACWPGQVHTGRDRHLAGELVVLWYGCTPSLVAGMQLPMSTQAGFKKHVAALLRCGRATVSGSLPAEIARRAAARSRYPDSAISPHALTGLDRLFVSPGTKELKLVSRSRAVWHP